MDTAPGLGDDSDAGVARYDRELLADAGGRLNRAIVLMERFLSREECRHWGDTHPTWVLSHSLAEHGRSLLRGALAAERATVCESALRSAYRLTGALGSLAAWTAPATQESSALNSFPAAASRDAVAYARYGCPEICAQEIAYASMLGFDPDQIRMVLTSSGMAAFSLIENFLLRDVVRPHDRLLLHPGIYFETRQQLQSLPFLKVHTVQGGDRADMLEAIAEIRPRVVFVDPLTNSMDYRAIDMLRLLDEADRICESETWFVIDGTLLSGGCNPFAARNRRNIRVLYYESGCKYLQFGMDLGPAGVVVVDGFLAERFLELRRGIGAITSEALVLPRASRAAYLDYLCAQTTCAVAVAEAVNALPPHGGRLPIEAVHPRLPQHPDYYEAAAYPHLGGVLMFKFRDAELNRRKPLEAFIDAVMREAVRADLPLTTGVSFGFRVPRIGAAWSSYDADHAFLRLSAGIDPSRAAQLGRLIGNCAQEFAPAHGDTI
jgi:cystathionine beta-lyase/cystathionine gamma-synthase